MSNELFYVKMSDLSAGSQVFLDNNKQFARRLNHAWLTKEHSSRNFTLRVDKQLYNQGIYLSPDLYLLILPRSSYILLIAAGIISGARLYIGRKRDRFSTADL